MQNKNWRIVGGVVIILLFTARIYLAYEERKHKEEQEQMFRDLSRMQSEEFNKNYNKHLDSILTFSTVNLDSMQIAMDSLGKKMKADQEAFEKKMKESGN